MIGFCLEVSGPYACFTRPEMKVERVSYDLITPSAARAIFDAILWKPAISWRVKRIEVLAPIRWVSVRRNEVGKVASPGSAGIFIDDGKTRQQRAGLFLRDVKYRLHAEFVLTDKTGADDTEEKFAAMFDRRATNGQCFNQPYLGCREFSAEFRLVDPMVELCTPIPETRDLGWMLYDMDFADPADPKPQFFHAFIENGVVDLTNVEVRS
jgi:CRISPR-associated protein Cas5d